MTPFTPSFTITNAITAGLLPDVARRTLQRDLKLLVDNGLVREVGKGPTDPTRHYLWEAKEL